MTEYTNLKNELKQLRKSCDAKLAQIKSKSENENETQVIRIEIVEESV
jgi:hypothetical protein